MTHEEFCKLKAKDMFPLGTSDKEALDILYETFLPKDFYIAYSCGREQANTEMVGYILKNFGRKKSLFKKIEKFLSSRGKKTPTSKRSVGGG